jgi:hypothetical protein
MKKIKKIAKKEEKDTIMNESFLDSSGKEVKISSIIDKDDCWTLKSKENLKWILTHKAIKKIAEIAGISKNYDVEESETKPEYKNELEHLIRVTIKCNAKAKGAGCIHSDEKTQTITGEANRINTPDRGRGYLRVMAEKRAYDIAVLEHLSLRDKVYSKEEADDFASDEEMKKRKEPTIMPGTREFEQINKEINAILNANDIKMLEKIAKGLKKRVAENKYTEKQIKYLRELYGKEIAKHKEYF